MSSHISRDRSDIWSYVPFGSSPRRRSVGSSTLPKSHMGRDNTPWDPFGKSDERSGGPTFTEKLQNSMMSQNRQGKALRMGSVAVIILLLYFFFFSGSAPSVADIGGGKSIFSSSNSPTTKCMKPYDSSKPLVQYAIMIDAGSTGSRIHVYKFNNCGSTPELESEEFKMTEKREGGSGLSAYKTDAEAAAKSLDPLLQVAMDTIPDEFKSCSPVAVKATAGLRLLGEEMSAKILDAVRARLETQYPFPVVSKEKGGVEIMPGEMEGVYAWITTNYLLGKIGGPDKSPTAAIFDLGGGSTQIVFQPTFPDAPDSGMPQHMEEGDHKYSLDFGGRSFELYQHSHLGYGLMSARKALHTLVVENAAEAAPDTLAWMHDPIPNPCIAPNASRRVDLSFPATHPLKGEHTVTMYGPSDSLPAQCRSLTEAILHKDAKCSLTPCSFNGVHQPSLAKTFAREDVYIFSYFYDRTKDLGMPDSFTIRELHDLTHQVCSGSDTWQSAFGSVTGAVKDLEERPEWCLDLNFMLALLHTGYELPIDREVKIAKKIGGNELGWCLGASLPLLEQNSGWSCKLTEVS